MPTYLDIRTLSYLAGVVSLTLAGAMIYISTQGKTYPGFRTWTTGFLFSFIGLVTLSLRSVIPDLFTIVVANCLHFVYAVQMDRGFSEFREKKSRRWDRIYIGAIIVQLAWFTFFTYQSPDISSRIVGICLLICLPLGHAFYQVAQLSPTLLKQRQWLLQLTFAGLFIWYTTRGILTIFLNEDISNFMQAGNIHGFSFVVLLSGNILLALGLVLLNNQRLAQDLSNSQEQVKKLEGLIPICSNCKKVRTDDGFWEHVDSYIATRTEAVFSHSICPDCVAIVYPDLDLSEIVDLK